MLLFGTMATDPDDVRFQGKTGSSRPTTKMTRLTQMYGPAVRCKRFSSSWRERSCINVCGL